VRATSGKILHAFATAAELEPADLVSNRFKLEWPPGSGRWTEFPEVDRAAWFPLEIAREKIHRGQLPLLDQLSTALDTAR
jgi:predicted NUDIX family NTP pyrophosphohydrolase